MVRVVDEVVERDQRVGLPAAICQLKLPDRLLVLAGQSQHDVPRQLSDVVRGVGEREELSRVLINGPRRPHHYVIEVGSERMQSQFA